MEKFADEKLRYNAVLLLPQDEYPELDNATIVFGDHGDKVTIGVKVEYMKEQYGDYITTSKDTSIGDAFNGIRLLIEQMSNAIALIKKSDKA